MTTTEATGTPTSTAAIPSTATPTKLPLPWPVLAVLSGVLLGLSQPIVIDSLTGKLPLDQSGLTGLLALIALVPAFLAVDGQGPKRAYAVGFVTHLVGYSIIIQWIITTIHSYGGLPLVVALPVLLLLTSTMAAYSAAAYAVSRVIAQYFKWSTWWVLPPVICAVEWLKNLGPLGGFPWGAPGHGLATIPVLLQGASLIGLTGLTFVVVTANVGIAAVVTGIRNRTAIDARLMGVAVVIVGFFVVFGAVRLQKDITSGPSVRVGLLQPNVNEGLADLVREGADDKLKRFQDLEVEALRQGAELIVWPEGSFPRHNLRRDRTDMKGTGLWPATLPDGLAPPKASVVGISVTGTTRGADNKSVNIRQNSAFVVDDKLNIHGRFDKSHLVPFGEYVPWPFGSIVKQFIPLGTTTPGNTLEPIEIDVGDRHLSIGVTVCYEGVFPEVSRALAKNGANFFTNLTDDRWYGVSGMATQHLLMYTLRAVENGRPVARATNTGISAWIDIHGGLHKKTGMYEPAVVVDDVPLLTTNTLYLRLGDWVAALSLLFTLLAWFAAILDVDVHRRWLASPMSSKVLVGIGIVLTVAGLALWVTGDGLDEASSTQSTLLTVAGLLVGVGAASSRPWGRKAVLVVGVLAVVFGALAVVLSKTVLAGAVLGMGVVLFMLGRKHVASRPPG